MWVGEKAGSALAVEPVMPPLGMRCNWPVHSIVVVMETMWSSVEAGLVSRSKTEIAAAR